MMRDFFREGHNIDVARLRAEHGRESPHHQPPFVRTQRNLLWARIQRAFPETSEMWRQRYL